YLRLFFEQQALDQRINYYLPVESPSHLDVRTELLRLYTCPSDRNVEVFPVLDAAGAEIARVATNSYAACYGANGLLAAEPDNGTGAFFRNSRVTLQDIGDGTASTILIGERGSLFVQGPWAGVIRCGTLQTTTAPPVCPAL